MLLKLFVMRVLYQKAYKRLLGRLMGSQEAGKIDLPATLTSYSHDILHRIPRDDFKLVIKVPCTVKEYAFTELAHKPRTKLSRPLSDSELMPTSNRERCASSAPID